MTSIFHLYPGDYIKINFPENFVLEYRTSKDKPIQSFVCTGMSVYRYDEEDRNDTNFYFYGADPKAQWITKSYYLTKESYDKVCDFLVEKLSKEGKIKVKDGHVIQPYS
jgi:hypothetical protein